MKKTLLCLMIACAFLCVLVSCTASPEESAPASSSADSVAESMPPAEESVSSEPEASEPEASEPEASEPEISEPEVSGPEVSEPEVSEPEVSEPEVSEPEVSEPEVSEPEVSEPEVSEPETVFAENVEISSSKEELYPGETATLTVTVTPEEATDKSVIWEIDSGSEYATLSADGVLTTKAAGTVVVKVTTKDGSDISAFYTITVKAVPASSITISGDKEVTAGGRITLTATVKPEDADKGVVWTVESGEKFASISADGVLTAVAPGEVVVKATAKDGSGVSATYTVTVKPVLVTSITISGNTTVEEGKTVTLSAAVKPDNATNKGVTWSIESGSKYASISADGVLTAKAAGKVTVKATAKDGSGVSATYTVTVKPVLVTSITISGNTTVEEGKTVTLSAAVKPSNASNKEVTWSIDSGSKYASISADGVLTAKAAGKVTVKATAKDGSGVSATYTVTVKAGAMWEGEGTKANPFLIKNLTDLKNLQKVVDKKGYYFLQVADIDCSSVETWIVIGTDENPFRHHYDGGGYTIKGLHFAGETGGLITVAEDATFRDIHIENVTARDVQAYLGSIVGYGINCSFYGCNAKVDFSGSYPNVGGIVGYVVLNENQTVLMENCHAEGTIDGGAYSGGLIGHIYKYYENNETPEEPKAAVTDCYANVEISVLGGAGDGANAGGLIGCSNGVKIHHCHATGNVIAKFEYLGGLVGQSGYACEIAYCYATGDVTCTSDDQYGGAFAGGLVGYMFSDTHVHDCYATGDISAPDVGWSNCQDKPSMDGGPWLNYRNPCGSLIGCIHVIGQSYKMELYNCYATGTVYAPKICEDDRVYCHGAVVGCIYDHVTRRNVIDKSKYDQTDWAGFSELPFTRLESCFNVEALRTYFRPITEFTRSSQRKYEMPIHEYVTIVTTTQLKDQSVFEGWDFQNVWIMGENGPELR